MPYIDDNARDIAAEDMDAACGVQDVGSLTYAIQQILKEYLEGTGLRYAHLAECLGALEGAKLDLIERIIKPYEVEKCQDNGDVWPLQLRPIKWA